MYEIFASGEGEYTEKKSRFISMVASVKSEEEAMAFLESKKKQYYDARHNCSAWRLCDASGEIRSRFSDDGEPSGTAGKPILEVLEGSGLVNAVCVVTRYFGGVLLGTGGLVRAYTEGAKRAVAAAKTGERRQGIFFDIETDYHGYGKVEYLLRAADVAIISIEYEAGVVLKTIVEEEQLTRLKQQFTEATAGQAVMKEGDAAGFAVIDGEVVLL